MQFACASRLREQFRACSTVAPQDASAFSVDVVFQFRSNYAEAAPGFVRLGTAFFVGVGCRLAIATAYCSFAVPPSVIALAGQSRAALLSPAVRVRHILLEKRFWTGHRTGATN